LDAPTALLFAREGAAIGLADVNADAAQRVADEIIQSGGRAFFESVDVTRAADCRRLVERAIREFGCIDVLFNNAGVIRRATVLDLSEEDWDRVMAVNVKSIFLLSREADSAHAEGRAAERSSTRLPDGEWPAAQMAAVYCASKGAVVLLTKAMAIDHGPQKIRVNCICPGDTDTTMLREEAQQLGEKNSHFLAEAAKRPLRRVGTPGGDRAGRALSRRAMRLRLSRARRWVWMAEAWRARFDYRARLQRLEWTLLNIVRYCGKGRLPECAERG
jgi:NAD(P)-dependent dehydrogenase (short-subunit alcohol dehydrogenase family)